MLRVTTTDRPGLLVDVVSVLKDINVNVVRTGALPGAHARACMVARAAHKSRNAACTHAVNTSTACCFPLLLENRIQRTACTACLPDGISPPHCSQVSAEIDTVGDTAQDEFFVTYHGEPLNPPMIQLVSNSLQYYLSLGEVSREESY